MPEIDLDFGGVGTLPDEGIYRVVCDKAVYKPNKKKTGFIINMQMHLTDMDDETFENFKLFDNPSLSPTARWKLKEVLDAFTFPMEWDEDSMKLEVDDDTYDEATQTGEVPILADKTALVLLYHESYEGKAQARVKTYFPDNGVLEIGPTAA